VIYHGISFVPFPLMKVVHLNKDKSSTDETAEEINRLLAIIKRHPANDKALNRLMILYRKQRNYTAELKLINKAIKTFEEIFTKKQTVHSRKIKLISTSLAKSLGLADKKGNSIYQKGDLTKWNRRKLFVQKKINALS
jgi:DNA-binding SARP family transcriptional activator